MHSVLRHLMKCANFLVMLFAGGETKNAQQQKVGKIHQITGNFLPNTPRHLSIKNTS